MALASLLPRPKAAGLCALRRCKRWRVALAVVSAALMLVSVAGELPQAWQGAQAVQRTTRTMRHAEEQQGASDAEAEERRLKQILSRKTKLQSGMAERLRQEATALGDEDTPIQFGYGNPILLIIVVVGVLGVASYYALGLDKASQKLSDEELMRRYVATSETMMGRTR
eukprot:TRINITY_DN64253_c0_g1_i1.p1 TRINITY_DN64253_c0_g1~~TRINITY_DN64253_c0_g1_i1.p1  ORF type:complete len:169 (+),score=35.19 TRINITY_DN64253_c0_g1_i1:64-570(+)